LSSIISKFVYLDIKTREIIDNLMLW